MRKQTPWSYENREPVVETAEPDPQPPLRPKRAPVNNPLKIVESVVGNDVTRTPAFGPILSPDTLLWNDQNDKSNPRSSSRPQRVPPNGYRQRRFSADRLSIEQMREERSRQSYFYENPSAVEYFSPLSHGFALLPSRQPQKPLQEIKLSRSQSFDASLYTNAAANYAAGNPFPDHGQLSVDFDELSEVNSNYQDTYLPRSPVLASHAGIDFPSLGVTVTASKRDVPTSVLIENIPENWERNIVALMVNLLWKNGAVTVGRMGSFLHTQTQNHTLSKRFKQKYGGLKKFCAKFSAIFVLVNDHQFNPTLILFEWTNPANKLAPHIITSLRSLSTAPTLNGSIAGTNNVQQQITSIFDVPDWISPKNITSVPHQPVNSPNIGISDWQLIQHFKQIIRKTPSITIGQVGTKIVTVTRNHRLPRYFKTKYGGLKKFFEAHGDIFVVGEDHPFNPAVFLNDEQHNNSMSHHQSDQVLRRSSSYQSELTALIALNSGNVSPPTEDYSQFKPAFYASTFGRSSTAPLPDLKKLEIVPEAPAAPNPPLLCPDENAWFGNANRSPARPAVIEGSGIGVSPLYAPNSQSHLDTTVETLYQLPPSHTVKEDDNREPFPSTTQQHHHHYHDQHHRAVSDADLPQLNSLRLSSFDESNEPNSNGGSDPSRSISSLWSLNSSSSFVNEELISGKEHDGLYGSSINTALSATLC